MLALKEAELEKQNVRFMNMELHKHFGNRTIEAIKKARQKASYRELVESFRNRRSLDEPEAIIADEPLLENDDNNNAFLIYIRNLPPLNSASHNSQQLEEIIETAESRGKDEVTAQLGNYLKSIYPPQPNRPRRIRHQPMPSNRRQRRRLEYKVTRTNWAKHQNRCIKTILEGPQEGRMPEQEVMVPFWENIMTQTSDVAPNEITPSVHLDFIWTPVTVEDLRESKPATSTSPGPDGITAKQIRKMPEGILVRIFNLILWCGKLPEHLYKSRTTMIPKTTNSTEPGDFRPIAVSSVLTRQLHNIMARRISNGIDLDRRQQAFIESDGCATNTTILDLLLRYQHLSSSSCYIASIDVAKAFDSVSHPTIMSTLRSYGIPTGLIRYINAVYTNSTTNIQTENWTSRPIKSSCGVKQGDPLSPIIFNMVIDRLLKSLPKEISAKVGTSSVNALAFADDLILCATTPLGLQELLNKTNCFLQSCGMFINTSKCKTISIKGQGKTKNTVVEERTFKLNNQMLPFIKRTETLKYLGLEFSPEGKCKINQGEVLVPKLQRVTGAPLKPQQRLHVLRTVLIPQLYHRLTLGNAHIGALNKTDRTIRKEVRKWLNLPNDVPTAYFHAPVEQGGLGIPAVRLSAPLIRLNRLRNLILPNLEDNVAANTYLGQEIDITSKRLRIDHVTISSKMELEKYWTEKLHASIDGNGLKTSTGDKHTHRWIKEPTKLLTGRDFIHCVKTRINALPSRSRTTRGRPQQDRTCRAGCPRQETVNHIVQQCPRTHSSRIDRHNSVIKYLRREATQRGLDTLEEPIIQTSDGPRKPDLVIKNGNRAVVIDAQIITDSFPLATAHRNKVGKYDRPEIRNDLRTLMDVDEVAVTSATLNWRGIWDSTSLQQLIDLGVLKKKDAALVSTRVLIGTYRSFRQFNEATWITNYEPG